MELEELKNIWNKNKAGFQRKDEAQLSSMLKGNSKSVVDKLKRSVWFELVFTLIASVAFLFYAFTLPSGALKWTTVSVLILFLAYSIYYVKKLLILNQFKPGDDHLKASVEKLVESLSSYLKFYKASYAILYPVYFGLGVVFGALETGGEKFMEKITDVKWVLYLVGLAVSFFLITMVFANWYLKKLYGNHLEKLKKLLLELNAGEPAS